MYYYVSRPVKIAGMLTAYRYVASMQSVNENRENSGNYCYQFRSDLIVVIGSFILRKSIYIKLTLMSGVYLTFFCY